MPIEGGLPMLFRQAIERFVDNMENIERSKGTIEIYSRDLIAFLKYLETLYNGPVYLEEITADDIENFLSMLKNTKNYAPNSRSRNLYTLRSFYKYAYKKEMVTRNIALSLDTIKLPKKERPYLTEEEGAELVDIIPIPIIKLVVDFLLNTGLRISECLNLTLDDVNLDTKVIHIILGKGAKDRMVPINTNIYSLLLDYRENWRDADKSERFFATRKTGALSAVYVNTTIRKAVEKLGWKKHVSCHILRHSFASALVKKNVGLVQIQKLLGHSSLAITSVYTHTNLDQLAEAVNAL